MDIQDMKQAGLAGDFLAENESIAPVETRRAHQAVNVPDGPSSAEESANSQKRANLVLAVLFLAGMAVVYSMSMYDNTTNANPLEIASETIVNAAVQQFQTNPGAVTNDTPEAEQANASPVELAREMITGTPKRQVPLEELKNNPFLLVYEKRAIPEKIEAVKPVAITPGVTALQRAETLQLQSIVVASDRSLAIISDRLLTVGQEIVGWRVHEIGNGQVTLKLKDLSYVLRVKQ